jgi:DNA end-binding protein Ku
VDHRQVAIVRVVMRSRQYSAALRGVDGRPMMSTFADADELVPVAEVDELHDRDKVEVGP